MTIKQAKWMSPASTDQPMPKIFLSWPLSGNHCIINMHWKITNHILKALYLFSSWSYFIGGIIWSVVLEPVQALRLNYALAPSLAKIKIWLSIFKTNSISRYHSSKTIGISQEQKTNTGHTSQLQISNNYSSQFRVCKKPKI